MVAHPGSVPSRQVGSVRALGRRSQASVRVLSHHQHSPAIPPDPALSTGLEVATEWDDLGPAYADAVAYAFTYLAGYLRYRPDSELVLVVLGDHQPPASVSGPEAPWEVPVHVITRRQDIMDALLGSGFSPGMIPRRPAIAAMHELTAMLLRAFASDSPEQTEDKWAATSRTSPTRD